MLHHLELVSGPPAGQQFLAVVRHPFGGAPVSGFGELAAVPVRKIVHEPIATLEAELGELALVTHGPGSIPLVREQAGTILVRPFDDEDFSLFAGLQVSEVALDIVDLVGDQPLGHGAHGRLPFGRRECETRGASSLDPSSEGSRDATEDARDDGVHLDTPSSPVGDRRSVAPAGVDVNRITPA